MEIGAMLFWLAAGLALVAAAWLLRALMARAARLRAHERRKQDYLRDRRRQARSARAGGQPGAPASLPATKVQAIRRNAEDAARRAGDGAEERPANPFRPGTREFVLWETSYGLVAAHLDEQEEAVPAGWRGSASRV